MMFIHIHSFIYIYVMEGYVSLAGYRCIEELSTTQHSETTKDLLKQMEQRPWFKPEESVTLCTLNRNVALYNAQALQSLPGKLYKLKANDTGIAKHVSKIVSADPVLYLKKGARVIVTANLSSQVVNGTTGTVKDIHPDHITICEDGSEVTHNIKKFIFRTATAGQVSSREQYPLKLAYAMTIHRAQGQTLAKVNIDFEGLFSHSLVPVALSRVKDPSDVSLRHLQRTDISSVPDVVTSYMEGTYIYQPVEMDFQVRCNNVEIFSMSFLLAKLPADPQL